jgi:GNAT superfamily N-acetyltransferase
MARVPSSEEILIGAIESSLFAYPPIRGLSADLGVQGMRGRVTDLSHPLANLVGMARLRDSEADATIAAVMERFAKVRRAFGWVTGPGTRPPDLDRRLGAAGMQPIAHLAGMSAPVDLPVTATDAVRIREVNAAEQSRETEMMGRAYGMPAEIAALFVRLLTESLGVRGRGYFAYLDTESPVAWSYLVYLPDSPIVLLGGAATLPEARGKGIYSALVKRRLEDARRDGREAAVIQADRDTSAPICAKLGFRELCSLEVFAWSPESRPAG